MSKKITEKVVVSMAPATVKIDIDAIPKHKMDAICRCLISMTSEAFKNPEVVAYHEKRIAAKKASGAKSVKN